MNRSLLWRGLLIAAVTALALLYSVPPKEKIKRGLDLQGGMHLVLQVKSDDAVRAETEKDMELLRREAAGKNLAGTAVRRVGDTIFEATGVPSDRDSVIDEIYQDFFATGPGNSPRWDKSRQGDKLVFTMTDANRADIRNQAVEQALQTINNRVDAFGVAEHQIARQPGSDRIIVQLPGVEDPDRVKDLIKNTAFLEFRLVDATGGGNPAPSREAMLSVFGGNLPESVEILPEVRYDSQGREAGEVFWALEKRQVITGRDLRTARVGGDEFQRPAVHFELSADGARIFGKVTSESIGRKLAVVLDGKVQSAATIQSRITDRGQITGIASQEEVQDLVLTLRSGALPAGIEYLEERTVGASLGADSVRRGIQAGLVATALTILAMFIVYSLTGFNAVAALALNVVLLFGALGLFGATVTLPGIAGIVLTIGMAFDANVLVFERIREELKAGRSVRSAIDAGFGKAMSSIVDSNITTLIAALFLFQFGTGPVRGFAVTLSVGILATLFAGVFFSRWLFDALAERRTKSDGKMSIWGLSFPQTSFDFMRYRKVWVGISFAVIAIGMVAAFGAGKLNFGIDFTGGTQLTMRFPSPPPVDEIRATLSAAGFEKTQIQSIGSAAENEILIRTPTRPGSEEGSAKELVTALKAKYPDFEVRSTENVGPQVGAELRKKGLLAVIASMLGMLVYIWFRFELRFGIGALMAVVHDVLVTLGLFAIFGFEFNLTTVAAFLTLVGYSVNDTVVVFDRVRENMRRSRRAPLVEIMNLSLNQTLSRTLLTGGTTLTACLALMILGGEVLSGFAFILFVGVIVGTYSSIYIASPFALLWEKYFGREARAIRVEEAAAAKRA